MQPRQRPRRWAAPCAWLSWTKVDTSSPFRRWTGCLPLAADEATNMAYTAAMFGEKGSEIVKMVGRPWFQSMIIATQGRIVPADGEMPIEIDGEIVGGSAAAGASNEQDVACCIAALDALKEALS